MGFPLESLLTRNDRRILLVVADGLGGLPRAGKTELETARTPNLDKLARESELGLLEPVGPGITPGSGPAHLALFGYDPVEHRIGRGVLEALGLGMPVRRGDVCVRANFATVRGREVVDRRAGRIATDVNRRLCRLLAREIPALGKVKVLIRPGMGHRFAVVLRGAGLDPDVDDADPQKDGQPVRPARARSARAQATAKLANEFIRRAAQALEKEPRANYVLLRGFSGLPHLEPMAKRFGLTPGCIATYPMYRGVAELVGMELLPAGSTWLDELESCRSHMLAHDFIYLHLKEIDARGEDGDFAGKVRLIEELDRLIPRVRALGFDVLAITADHSTPALMKAHSWHPCPVLIHSDRARGSGEAHFSEQTCARGSLGLRPALALMPLLLAHAGKLGKFGA